MCPPTAITGPPRPSPPITCRRCGPTSTPAAASLTISKSRTLPRCRPPAISGPMPPRPASPCAISATWSTTSPTPRPAPAAGYLWTNAAAAGVSLRNFGYMVNNKPNAAPGAEQISGVRDPVLAKVTNPLYRGFDLNYADVERAKVFLSELAEYEKTGNMPRLIVMRLGNDHTSGTAAGKIAPLSAAADNDYAVGQLVEGVSRSRFWASTAIFILEDDAQNGPDHVDSHRSPAFVISPWVKRHAVDSSMYNTTSMLRTMEFLLGMKPMTH